MQVKYKRQCAPIYSNSHFPRCLTSPSNSSRLREYSRWGSPRQFMVAGSSWKYMRRRCGYRNSTIVECTAPWLKPYVFPAISNSLPLPTASIQSSYSFHILRILTKNDVVNIEEIFHLNRIKSNCCGIFFNSDISYIQMQVWWKCNGRKFICFRDFKNAKIVHFRYTTWPESLYFVLWCKERRIKLI